MLKMFGDVLVAIAALVALIVAGGLALVAWAAVFSLPLALFWAAFRAWARIFGA